jgi:hypothetical protein
MRFAAASCALAFMAAPSAATATPAAAAVWQAKIYEPTLKPVNGEPLPLTAVGRARYEKTIADLKRGAVVDNAVYTCLSQGMPRAMTSAYPFQVIVTKEEVTFLYEENRAYRIVKFADQHADPALWDPSYMGDGVASWSDENHLVIDSTNFKSGKMYLDATGLPASDQLHLIEHLRVLNGGAVLEDMITVDDPLIFTKPWTARRVFARRDDIELKTDWVCGEKHREVSAAVSGVAKSRAPDTASTNTSAQVALNGYWINAVAPVSALSIAQVAAGTQRTAPGMVAMLRNQQPWAAAERNKAMAALAAGQYVPTPEMQCLPAQPPGTSRIAPGGYGLEILVSPRYVVILAEANAIMRIIRINQSHPLDLIPGWQGDSIGQWEGDTLIVDTIGFNGKNYLDRGIPFTSKMHIVERLRLVNGQLVDEATFDDPGAFTAPFNMTNTYRRSEPFQEYICQENNHEGGVPTSTGRPTQFNLPQVQAH